MYTNFHALSLCTVIRVKYSQIYNVPVAQVTLIMDAYHVSSQTAFAFELLEADTAVVTRTLMLSLDMHVAPSC